MAQTRVVINCVALYYTKGASGTNYIKKEKFRAEIPREETNLRTLKNIFRYVFDALPFNFIILNDTVYAKYGLIKS